MIVDAHLHLPATGPGLGFGRAKAKLLSDMAAFGLDYAVVIPDNAPGSPIGDMDVCLELLGETPQVFLLGAIDVLTQGRKAADRLDELPACRSIRGVKLFPGHDPIYPTDERLTPVYDLCRRHGLPVVIHTGWNVGDPAAARFNDPRHIAEVARAMPDLAIIISHYFWPRVDYCYEVTCEVPNISYDISGLADEEVIRQTGRERIRDVLVRTTRDKPQQVLFGSDYAMCDPSRHVALVRSLPVSPELQNAILSDNAIGMFQLDVPHAERGLRRGGGPLS